MKGTSELWILAFLKIGHEKLSRFPNLFYT